ncbi:MAG TPA: dihydrofolate reductase family protein [Gaiellaceae bacterium]|nr:dihydrofolate reductase family protein [Gaiellaceae bacterium]
MIEAFTVLAEDGDLPRWDVPDALAELYGGAIGLDEPCVVANFVESLDGVVAVPRLPRSAAVIGDESKADSFMLALLRACADAVVVGSGTLLASPNGTWRTDRAYPPAAAALAELRAARGRPEQPLLVVVTAGGSFDPAHPVLETRALVLTTEAAADGLRASVPEATEVVAVNGGDSVDLALALDLLRERGHPVVLAEAGPSMFGSLLASRLVDELFLTVSPVLAGRAAASVRLGLVEGVELLPDTRVAGRLRSVRTNGSHLFLRYGFR